MNTGFAAGLKLLTTGGGEGGDQLIEVTEYPYTHTQYTYIYTHIFQSIYIIDTLTIG